MAGLKAMRSLSDLGRNIKQARLSRRFSIAELAMRGDVSERTLTRLEKGDPGVGIGNLAAVLAALGSPEALAEVMSPENDAVGFSRALQAVPKRGRSFKPVTPAQTRDETGRTTDPDYRPRKRDGVGF